MPSTEGATSNLEGVLLPTSYVSCADPDRDPPRDSTCAPLYPALEAPLFPARGAPRYPPLDAPLYATRGGSVAVSLFLPRLPLLLVKLVLI